MYPKVPNPTEGGSRNGHLSEPYRRGGPVCSCCPFGSHIDVDFVRYCEALSSGAYLKQLRQVKKYKRKKRPNLEVMMGYLQDSEDDQALQKDFCLTDLRIPSYRDISKSQRRDDGTALTKGREAEIFTRALQDAVFDFEDVLQRSNSEPSPRPIEVSSLSLQSDYHSSNRSQSTKTILIEDWGIDKRVSLLPQKPEELLSSVENNPNKKVDFHPVFRERFPEIYQSRVLVSEAESTRSRSQGTATEVSQKIPNSGYVSVEKPSPVSKGKIQTREIHTQANPSVHSTAAGGSPVSFVEKAVETDTLTCPDSLKKDVQSRPCVKCIQRLGRRMVDAAEFCDILQVPSTRSTGCSTDAGKVWSRGSMTLLFGGDFLTFSEHNEKVEMIRSRMKMEHQLEVEKQRKKLEALGNRIRDLEQELQEKMTVQERELLQMNEKSRAEERRHLEHQFRLELERRVKELEEEVERKEDIREEELKRDFKIEVQRRVEEIQDEMRWNLREVAVQVEGLGESLSIQTDPVEVHSKGKKSAESPRMKSMGVQAHFPVESRSVAVECLPVIKLSHPVSIQTDEQENKQELMSECSKRQANVQLMASKVRMESPRLLLESPASSSSSLVTASQIPRPILALGARSSSLQILGSKTPDGKGSKIPVLKVRSHQTSRTIPSGQSSSVGSVNHDDKAAMDKESEVKEFEEEEARILRDEEKAVEEVMVAEKSQTLREPPVRSTKASSVVGLTKESVPDRGFGIRDWSYKPVEHSPSDDFVSSLHTLHSSLPVKDHAVLAKLQKEWFQISSTKQADVGTLDKYLNVLEEFGTSQMLSILVNMTDGNGNTALHYAVSHGNFDVAAMLLDTKVVDTSLQNKVGYTCIMLVSLSELSRECDREIVRKLFSLGDVNMKATMHGQTALMLAASHGRVDMVRLLVETGADVNIQDSDGSTALMCAAEHGHVDVVKYLLQLPDCDATVVDNDGSNALQIAMDAGHKDIGVLIYASLHFSRGSSPHGSLKMPRRVRSPIIPPPRGAVTPPPPTAGNISPTPSRKSNKSVA